MARHCSPNKGRHQSEVAQKVIARSDDFSKPEVLNLLCILFFPSHAFIRWRRIKALMRVRNRRDLAMINMIRVCEVQFIYRISVIPEKWPRRRNHHIWRYGGEISTTWGRISLSLVEKVLHWSFYHTSEDVETILARRYKTCLIMSKLLGDCAIACCKNTPRFAAANLVG